MDNPEARHQAIAVSDNFSEVSGRATSIHVCAMACVAMLMTAVVRML
jgi:hypothetical protein